MTLGMAVDVLVCPLAFFVLFEVSEAAAASRASKLAPRCAGLFDAVELSSLFTFGLIISSNVGIDDLTKKLDF